MSLVFDVERCRLSPLVFPTNGEKGEHSSRQVLASLVAEYDEFEDFASEDFVVRPGCTCAVPWERDILSLTLQLFMLDGMETVELGVATWDPSFLQRLEAVTQEKPSESLCVDVVLPIMKGSNTGVGKVSGRISVVVLDIDQIQGEDDGSPQGNMNGVSSRMAREAGIQAPLPKFTFVPMTKAMNWESINSIDLNHIIANTSLHQLDGIMSDLCYGGLALNEDVEADPALLNAIGLQQLSIQYMTHCGQFLDERASFIETTLRSYEDEEKSLDLLTAKLSGRIHAYKRENASLDALQANYINVLDSINPDLYQEYVRSREAGDRRSAAEIAQKERRAAVEEKQSEIYRERKEEKLRKVQQWNEQAAVREDNPESAMEMPIGRASDGGNTPERTVQKLGAESARTESLEKSLDGDPDGVRPFAAPDVARSHSHSPATVAKSRFVQISTPVDTKEGDPASPLPREGAKVGTTPLSLLPGSPLASPLVTHHKELGVPLTGGMSVDSFDSTGHDHMKRKLPLWAHAAPVGATAVTTSLASAMSADSLGGAGAASADAQGEEYRGVRTSASASVGEVASKPPLWVQAALSNAASGSSLGVAASSMQSAMSVDSLAVDAPAAPTATVPEGRRSEERRVQKMAVEEASESSSSSSEEELDQAQVQMLEEEGGMVEVTPSKPRAAAGALSVASPDEDFSQAEAIAIEEATGRADQQDSAVEDGEKGLQEQEQERGGFMDVLRATTTDEFDGPQVPHLTVSAPVPREPGSTPDGRAPILASPPWAQVQGQEQEQEERAVEQGELQDVDDSDLVQDFTMSMSEDYAGAAAGEDKAEDAKPAASDDKVEGKSEENIEDAARDSEADAKEYGAAVEDSKSGFKGAKEDDKGLDDSRDGDAPRMLNVSYSADNLIATDVTYTEDVDFLDPMGPGNTPGAAHSLERSGSFFNESDVMGRSQEDYYDSYDYGREELSPPAAQQRSWLTNDMNISQQSDGIAVDGGRHGAGAANTNMSYYEEGSLGLDASSNDEDEEPVVLFGARREGASTSRAGDGHLARVRAQSQPRQEKSLSLSHDSDDEEYAEDFDEPVDDNDDDVLIGTKTVNRSSLELNLGSTGGSSTESGLPPTGKQSLGALTGGSQGTASTSTSSGHQSMPTLSSTANTKSMEQLKGLLGTSQSQSQSAPPTESIEVSASAATADTGDGPLFRSGRASVDVLSEGGAMDIFVSSVLLNDATKEKMGSLQLQFFFMSEHSTASNIHHFPALSGGGSRMKMLPVNYAASINASDSTISSLSDEIQMEEEALSCSLFVQDGSSGENVGRAKINIWRMIEDSMNILRQEVDIYSLGDSGSAVIGSIIVDVRGFALLAKAMQN